MTLNERFLLKLTCNMSVSRIRSCNLSPASSVVEEPISRQLSVSNSSYSPRHFPGRLPRDETCEEDNIADDLGEQIDDRINEEYHQMKLRTCTSTNSSYFYLISCSI